MCLSEEAALQQIRKHWLQNGVKYLLAHPRTGDRYYTSRNPFTHIGSQICQTLKVVPGSGRGAANPATLYRSFSMDVDGDNQHFMAVLHEASKHLQEQHFGPEQRLFETAGELQGGLTKWPMSRWADVTHGPHLSLHVEDALFVMSAVGLPLVPPDDVLRRSRHAPGTVLRSVRERQYDLRARPMLALAEREGPPASSVRVLAFTGTAWVCRQVPRASVWRAQISGADLFGCLLLSLWGGRHLTLRDPDDPRESYRHIYKGGAQVQGGALCCFHVCKVLRGAAEAWERLVLKVLIGRRTGGVEAEAPRRLRADHVLQQGALFSQKRRKVSDSDFDIHILFRWFALYLRMRSAERATGLCEKSFEAIVRHVAQRDKLTAQKLVTACQHVGNRLYKILHCRAHRHRGAAATFVDKGVRAINVLAKQQLPTDWEDKKKLQRAMEEGSRLLAQHLVRG